MQDDIESPEIPAECYLVNEGECWSNQDLAGRAADAFTLATLRTSLVVPTGLPVPQLLSHADILVCTYL